MRITIESECLRCQFAGSLRSVYPSSEHSTGLESLESVPLEADESLVLR